MSTAPLGARKLDQLDREELLATTRRLLAEAQALSSRIAAVNEIGIAINRTFNLDKILQVVASQAKWLLDFDHLSVCLKDEHETWQVIRLFGDVEAITGRDLLQSENISFVLRAGQSRLIREAGSYTFLGQYASQIIVPLVSEVEVIGTINFARIAPQSYTQDDVRIGYMLGLQLASAIRNSLRVRELRQTQEALQRYAQELEQTNQELDTYNHTIAHDLKSPLAGILLNADLVKRISGDALPEKAEYYLNNIKTSTKKMSTMIDQLLWLAKLRDTSEALHSVNVRQVVESAVARFHHLIDEKHIRIEIMPDIPSALAHDQWIEEIFANFISNAIKYMGVDNPAPHIVIRGRCIGDDRARFEVTDNGVGIAEADQEKLFAMFTRLHTVKAEGLGLGLSIVQRIISRLNGELGVESTSGEGSTFWFILPCGDAKSLTQTQ